MFQATAQDGLARCGLLITQNLKICTPTPMLYTRRGGCLYLTPDMMNKLRPQAQLVQVNTMQFMQLPSPDILKESGKSIHHYLGIPSWPIMASNRDPTLTEYISTKPSSNTAAYCTIHTGGITVSPARYMQAVAVMQPDMFVTLADEVAADARPKRVAQSVDRTIKWLDECIQHTTQAKQQERQSQQQQHQQQQQDAQAGKQQQQQQQPEQQTAGHSVNANHRGSAGPAGPAVFAAVVGAASAAERKRSAQAAAGRAVAGFALCGFGMGEPPSARSALLSAAVQHLPTDKPRLAAGLDNPEDILEAVALGVDLFDCTYPTYATSNGYALCFPLKPSGQGGVGTSDNVNPDVGADDTKVNLWSVSYRMDKRPLVEGCRCFSCKNHSRSYIHHLLHTHEMLASVLLELHNTHWWLTFFAAIQEAIQERKLEQHVAWFKKRRQQLQLQQ